MLKGKIHRATVTEQNLGYEGSITIDENLMDFSGIIPYEQVHIYNVTNGNRFETYTIADPRGSGVIAINCAAAHQARKEDIIIIAVYGLMDEQELASHQPRPVYVDETNTPLSVGPTD